MESSAIEHLHNLLTEHRKRLQAREIQAAKYGLGTPPEIAVEIDDLRKEIAALEQRLGELVTLAPVVHFEPGGWILKGNRQLEDILPLLDEVREVFPHEQPDPKTPEGFGPRLLKELLLYFLLLKAYPPLPHQAREKPLPCFNQSKIMDQIRYERQNAHVVELSGPSGIGKTHVMGALQHEEDRERRGISKEQWGEWRYAYISGNDHKSLKEIMTAFIAKLAPSYKPSDSLTQSLAQCLFKLSSDGVNHVLFILDDADLIENDILLALADDDGPVSRSMQRRLRGMVMTLRLVVVTRRPRFARLLVRQPDIRIHSLQMDALNLADVRDMIEMHAPPGLGNDLDDTISMMAEVIHEITGGHPGAIEIILRTPDSVLFTLIESEYRDRFRPIVLNIVHRDIIGNLNINEYLLLNVLSIFRRLHVGVIWELLEIRLLPSNLLSEVAAPDEIAVRRWLDELVSTSALIRRNQRSAPFPFSVHPVLRRVLPLALGAHNSLFLHRLHERAYNIYDRRLRARGPSGLLLLPFPMRAFYTMEALYHFVQSWLVTPVEPGNAADAAEQLVALTTKYCKLFYDSYKAQPPGERDPAGLREEWIEEEELRKLIARLPDGAAAAQQIGNLFEAEELIDPERL